MARNEDVAVPANVWTELTNGDAQIISFQNKSRGGTMMVEATVGDTPPSTGDGASYPPGTGEYGLALSSAFPGTPGANRVWAFSTRAITVFVSHA